MTTNNYIDISELDFSYIKSSLKDYLKNQEKFNDFNFDAAGINIILDILAANTAANAYTASMMGNEAFIDSAQLRQSIVSLAKQIGYTPYSVTAAKANIEITLKTPTPGPNSIELVAGTKFTNSSGIPFSAKDSYTLYKTGVSGTDDVYIVEDVDIYEGVLVKYKYIATGTLNEKFVIPAINADISTLKVEINPSTTSTEKEIYTKSDNITVLTNTSLNFFLQENSEGYFEIYFGDGIIGKALSSGNVVNLYYIVSAKTDGSANNISSFSNYQSISGYGNYTVETSASSYGGADKQSIEEIRQIAPKMYQAQNRAVILDDYKTFLLNNYSWISSLNVWGGEDNVPPIYGKVFITIQPSHINILADSVKKSIIDDLIKNYNVVTVIPEIVDPTYLYIGVTSNVYNNPFKTTLNNNDIKTTIDTIITTYFNNIKKFGESFYYSPLLRQIDAADTSIKSSLVSIHLQSRFTPTLNIQRLYNLSMNNEIVPLSVKSTLFNPYSTTYNDNTAAQYIVDDGEGLLLSKNNITGLVINNNVGTVDYNTGKIDITILPYSLPLDSLDIRVNATPVSNNISPANNQIIMQDDSLTNNVFMRVLGINTTMINQ